MVSDFFFFDDGGIVRIFIYLISWCFTGAYFLFIVFFDNFSYFNRYANSICFFIWVVFIRYMIVLMKFILNGNEVKFCVSLGYFFSIFKI